MKQFFKKASKIIALLSAYVLSTCLSFAASSIDSMDGKSFDAGISSYTDKIVKVLNIGLTYVLYLIPFVGIFIIGYFFLVKVSNPKKANEAIDNIKTTAWAVAISFGVTAIFKAIVKVLAS